MAESVTELDEKPPLSTVAMEAMDDLGDWAPEPPAGCSKWLADGSPFRAARLDTDRGLSFHLYTNGFSCEELTAVAQSVTEK